MKMVQIRYLLMLVVLASVFSQNRLQLIINDEINIQLSFDSFVPNEIASAKCLEQMRNILTPKYFDTLSSMMLFSGKGINQVGLYDQCKTRNDLDYVMLSVYDADKNQVMVSIGVCGPKQCNTPENYSIITDQLVILLKNSPRTKDANLEGRTEILSEINSETLDFGAWMMICILILILIFWIIGLIVQFTPLGDKQAFSSDEAEYLKIEDKKNKIALFFYCFNPYVNLVKLFTISNGGEQNIAVLNGVRILSICWVVVGHSFSFTQFAPLLNFTSFFKMFDSPSFILIPGGLYAVDSFFFLSGFLTFYLLCTKMYPKKGKMNYLMLCFHRYYRLFFPLVFTMGFCIYLMRYLGDGPFYKRSVNKFFSSCGKYWWPNLFYINNLYPWELEKECTGWVWYLANDFQFFLISPFIIYAFCKNRKNGYLICFALILICMLCNGIITAVYNISITNTTGDVNGMDVLYVKPWGRIGAYIVGSLFGFSYFEYVCKEKHPELKDTFMNNIYEKVKGSRFISIAFLVVGVGLTSLYAFPIRSYFVDCIDGPNCYSRFISTLYNFGSRPFFVLGLGLAIFPTFVGRLRCIKYFLGSNIFAVLARLNYTVYMIHCCVIIWMIGDMRQPAYMNMLNEWFLAIGCVCMSFLFAIPVTLICESPFLNIEKYLLFPPAQRKPLNNEYLNNESKFYINFNLFLEFKREEKYNKLIDEGETIETEK